MENIEEKQISMVMAAMGSKGGLKTQSKLSTEERSAIAKGMAKKRWDKYRDNKKEKPAKS